MNNKIIVEIDIESFKSCLSFEESIILNQIISNMQKMNCYKNCSFADLEERAITLLFSGVYSFGISSLIGLQAVTKSYIA